MNGSDFLFPSVHHFLSLLKVGQQGFPALRRFLPSKHLVFVIPLYRIHNIWHQKSQQLVSFCCCAVKLKTTVDLRRATRTCTQKRDAEASAAASGWDLKLHKTTDAYLL